MSNMENLIKRLKRHEGLRLEPYEDDKGNLAIGYRHKIHEPCTPIALHKAEELLRKDAYHASDQLTSLGFCKKLSVLRREVCCEMIFWFGLRGFLRFQKMIAAIEREDFETAADEMLDSRAGRRYKTRMSELATLMRVG